MCEDYIKFLNTKLYLIESISRKGMLAGDEKLTEIHNICIASPEQVDRRLRRLYDEHKT